MKDDIAPIPTLYHNVLFRSRLEARWPVYFDAIGYQWIYEPDTFDLGHLGWYLPDFLVAGCYAEVKPCAFGELEEAKAKALAVLTDTDVILLVGVPDCREYGYYGSPTRDQKDVCALVRQGDDGGGFRPYFGWGCESPLQAPSDRWIEACRLANSERFGVYP